GETDLPESTQFVAGQTQNRSRPLLESPAETGSRRHDPLLTRNRQGTIQPEADEKWVLLQDGGDAFKERLLEEQHGDATGEKQNVPPELSEEDLEKLAHWCRSGSYNLSDVMGIIRNVAARFGDQPRHRNVFVVFQGALREENLEWFPHVLADVAMVYGLTASIVTSAALVFRMCTDVKATSKAVLPQQPSEDGVPKTHR
ncbi:hypothetical protein MRX96_056702, partial [Rhipicephalus microplus]